MVKRTAVESHESNNQHSTAVTTGQHNIRKRKRNSNNIINKKLRINVSNNNYWHENDDEDSSSSDGLPLGLVVSMPRNSSSKQANNSSILLSNSLNLSLTQSDNTSTITESPKPVYTLRPSVVNGTVLYDLTQKPWRLGRPIGKGNFGEIFLASDNISIPVTNENAKFVVKIEPHSNGPLFVEIHCLMNTAKKNYTFKQDETTGIEKSVKSNNIPIGEPSGIPDYIASGSHYFGNARYRFLVLPRFDRDLHSLIKKCRVHQKSVLTLGIHIINVLENLHDRGYCHNDVKAQNLMISRCKYLGKPQNTTSSSSFSNRSKISDITANGKQAKSIKSSKYEDQYDEKQQTTDSGNSSEQEANEEYDEDFIIKRKIYNGKDKEQEDESPIEDDEDEDFDDGATTNSMNSTSRDTYQTPLIKSNRLMGKRTSSRNIVQYSGSNPVRSCRREKPNSIYDEMVKSHYLRPTKRVSYTEFFNEDAVSVKGQALGDKNSYNDMHSITSEDDSEDFVPHSLRRNIKTSAKKSYTTNLEYRRLTRRQEKLLSLNNKPDDQMHYNATNNDKNKLKTERNDNFSHFRQNDHELVEINDERIFLIDYGLASKFVDNGVHRPFVMDQRRAHDGTLEFTSRDAHMGAHSRRSDMECLGYNLLFWSQGYLPWKEAATNQQQEKVHRAKEFLMTDVRELLMQIYGKKVPKYLGEYLHMVGKLAYHERPNYKNCRRIFEREYEQLGYPLSQLRLEMREIQQTSVRVKEEIENKNDFFETNKNNGSCNMVLNIMQNLSVSGTPFHERTLSNRVSPKNLRSKSGKKDPKKKKFSWAEILSQDPDQIARERAEKEFDREEELSDVQQPISRRYQGKPTKAIRAVLSILGRSVSEYEEEGNKVGNKYEQSQVKNENKMEMDDSDSGKSGNKRNEAEYMEADNDDECYQERSCDDDETDTSETSEKYTRRKVKEAISKQKTNTKRKANKNSGKAVKAARKLIMKTPVITPTTASTPICARTRRKGAATTVIDLVTPSPIVSKAKLTKSTKKRSSAIKSCGHKSSSSTKTSSVVAETEQYQENSNKKRTHRTRRRILKTDIATSDSLQDDSVSNFSRDIWKMNTEVIYSRNCKK